MFGVGEPGRHLSGCHRLTNCLRPRPGGLIVEQRHRRDVVRAVTTGAPAVEDRRDVLGKRGSSECFSGAPEDSGEDQSSHGVSQSIPCANLVFKMSTQPQVGLSPEEYLAI